MLLVSEQRNELPSSEVYGELPQFQGPRILPQKVRFPDLNTAIQRAFPIGLNPFTNEVDPESHSWFGSYGTLDTRKFSKFRKIGFGLFSGMTFVDAPKDRLRVSMDFVLWLFAFDDCLDEGVWKYDANGLGLSSAVVFDSKSADGIKGQELAFLNMLQDFSHRMSQSCSSETMERFWASLDKYVSATKRQAGNRGSNRVLTTMEFIEMRQDTSAVDMVWAVLEYSLNLDMPIACHDDPAMKELKLAANDILTWANDIYSFPIEYIRGDYQNLVFATLNECDVSTDRALNLVNRLLQERIAQYLDAKAALLSRWTVKVPCVTRYVLGIEYWVRGSIEWMFETNRYFGPQTPHVQATNEVDTSLLKSIANAHVQQYQRRTIAWLRWRQNSAAKLTKEALRALLGGLHKL